MSEQFFNMVGLVGVACYGCAGWEWCLAGFGEGGYAFPVELDEVLFGTWFTGTGEWQVW